ncbi:AAA family ATPase [Blastopirellula retiformator]|uniref:Secreted protein n=1 Tax=Blastopirellula retiformator TaxID=2527970 RepID=A0A5C5UUX7_9BACT|nr:ATP-binding protein [Blastopirellula retiformator]TWT29282.1 hypothetical protein Enr8_50830 [Blastopirellula retiformator]
MTRAIVAAPLFVALLCGNVCSPLSAAETSLPGPVSLTAQEMSIAEQLAETYAIDHLQTDAIRHELFGASDSKTGYGQAIYQPANRELVYDHLFAAAAERLPQGQSVIVDGTFLSADQRRRVVQLAHQHQANAAALVCQCPEETAQQRIVRRAAEGASLSEANLEVLAAQRDREEPDPPSVVNCLLENAIVAFSNLARLRA